jgi:two-component system sensor histidine kinase VicK
MSLGTYSLRTIKDIGKLSKDGILVFDIDENKITYCNNALGRMLDVQANEIKESGWNRLFRMLKDDADLAATSFVQLKTKGSIRDVELRIDGLHTRYISVDAYLLTKANVIVAFVKDITKSKEHMNYIVEFGARKNTVLDMISHNLSGPLNLTNNLLDVIDQVNRRQHLAGIDNAARLIRENTQQCIDVINSFLKEEHLLSPEIAVEMKRFDVLAKIDIIVERYRQFARQKRIKVLSESRELFVTGDDVKFFQVINNIISNAIKFTDDKGKITIEVTDCESRFSVSVKDNGIGIPEYLQPHLFKKNTPAGRPGLRGESSIGMGLYIVSKLVDLMKGSITFESEENKGTTFMVEFPKNA